MYGKRNGPHYGSVVYLYDYGSSSIYLLRKFLHISTPHTCIPYIYSSHISTPSKELPYTHTVEEILQPKNTSEDNKHNLHEASSLMKSNGFFSNEKSEKNAFH